MSRNRGDKEEGKSFSGKGKDTYKDSRHEKAWAHRGRGGDQNNIKEAEE